MEPMGRREDKHDYIREWVDMGHEMKYEKNIGNTRQSA